jgi:ribonuclease III
MGPRARPSLQTLVRELGYQFKDIRLLETALTHKSFVNEHPEERLVSNERLEFLGDAVLDLAISHILMDSNPDEPEGVLSKRRAALVNEKSLAQKARSLRLGKYLQLGKGEERTRGRQKISLLANAYEALLAAIYLDGGFEAAFHVIWTEFHLDMTESSWELPMEDFKTRLQEFTQAVLKVTPQYILVGEKGPDHEKVFYVELNLGEGLKTMGHGRSKKEAEQRAAREILERLQRVDEIGYFRPDA